MILSSGDIWESPNSTLYRFRETREWGELALNPTFFQSAFHVAQSLGARLAQVGDFYIDARGVLYELKPGNTWTPVTINPRNTPDLLKKETDPLLSKFDLLIKSSES